MKNEFFAWYPKTPQELSALWDAAIFVPDTNVLLHCLRHAADVRDELLKVFEALGDALWIPHQVGLEFHRRRLDVEFHSSDAFERLRRDYETVVNQARDRVRQLRAHPTISVERELAAIDAFEADFVKRLEEAKAKFSIEDLNNAVEKLLQLFEGQVGPAWTQDKIDALTKEGEKRYAKKTPPGYGDIKKEIPDRYGDLMIWKDMIEKAKADARPIIFVSDDAKEDWWRIDHGRKLGPRPELIEEFKEESGQLFHMYEFRQFLRIAAEKLGEIPPAKVEQIDKSLREDEQARRHSSELAEATAMSNIISALEDEREQIIASLAGVPSPLQPAREDTLDKSFLRTRLAELDTALSDARTSLAELRRTSDVPVE